MEEDRGHPRPSGQGTLRVEKRKVGDRIVSAYVYTPWWLCEGGADRLSALLAQIPPTDRALYRVERVQAASASSEVKEDVAIVYRRRPDVIVKVKSRRKRGYTRIPIFRSQPVDSRVSHRTEWEMESPMANEEKRTIVLNDGKTTDNTGWERMERGAGQTPWFKKYVGGKLYIIDHWKAMAARIPESFGVKVGKATPPSSTPKKEAFVWTPPERKERHQPSSVTIKPSAPKKEAPKVHAHSMGAVLSKQMRKLTEDKPKQSTKTTTKKKGRK